MQAHLCKTERFKILILTKMSTEALKMVSSKNVKLINYEFGGLL